MRLRLDRAGERELERQVAHAALVRAKADLVKAEATRNAGKPWMPRKGHEPIEVHSIPGGFRIANTDFAAHLKEWGSIRSPARAPLRRAARSAGLRFSDRP